MTISVSVQGWFDLKPAPPAVPVGPQPNAGMIEDEPSNGPAQLTFTPPVDEPYTLSPTTGNRVSLSVGGTLTGHYSPLAVDDAGEVVPATISPSGEDLVVTMVPTQEVAYPIVVVATFNASDPENSTVQELYPDPGSLPVADESDPLTNAEVVQAVDDAAADAEEELTNPSTDGEVDPGEVTTLSSAPKKVKIPYWRRPNGSRIIPKFYVYDPKNHHGRNPSRTGWHDYCTSSADSGQFSYGYPGTLAPTVSFRGPCARHDLCIQFKQADNRSKCDPKIRADMKQNCRYYIRADIYPSRGAAQRDCYNKAGVYYYWVSRQTKKKCDQWWEDCWGHNDWQSVYPTYRWDDWTQ